MRVHVWKIDDSSETWHTSQLVSVRKSRDDVIETRVFFAKHTMKEDGYGVYITDSQTKKMVRKSDPLYNGRKIIVLADGRKLWASLRGRSTITRVVEVGEEDLVSQTMEVFGLEKWDGTSLSDVMKRGPLPEIEALKWMSELVAGLEELRAEGIAHRDLKPMHALIVGDKLMLTGLDVCTRDALSYEYVGSYMYLPPELGKAWPTSTRTVDIYALGLIFREMLTNSRDAPTEEKLSEFSEPCQIALRGTAALTDWTSDAREKWYKNELRAWLNLQSADT